jgi:hypothetical protein
VQAHGSRKHLPFELAALLYEIVDFIPVADATRVLLDDRRRVVSLVLDKPLMLFS